MLTLVENLFLLSIDDARGTSGFGIYGELYYGLAGGILAELVMQGRLAAGKNALIEVLDATPTGNDLLDEALAKIATARKPRRAGHWISVLPSRKLPRRIAEQLVAQNILRVEEKRYLWVIPFEFYQQRDASAKYWLKQHLRDVILAGGKAEPQDVALLNLLRACNLLKSVFTKDERKWAQVKIKAMATEEVFGTAVAEVLRSIEVALVAATVAATSG